MARIANENAETLKSLRHFPADHSHLLDADFDLDFLQLNGEVPDETCQVIQHIYDEY